jgi:hypothetical protein
MSPAFNQRTFERIPFKQKVNVVSMGRMVAYAMAINIGMGGVLLRSASHLPVGSQCRLTLPAEGGEGSRPFEAEGTVVRSDAEGTAVRFSSTLDQNRFQTLFRQSAGAQSSILASYQAYFRVSMNQDLADCEKLLGVSKQTFKTSFYVSFFSCISLAIIPVWIFRNSIPASPNWIRVLLSFGYGAIWLAVIQPSIDLTVFHFVKQRQSS